MGWDHEGWDGAAAGARWVLVDAQDLLPRAKPGGHMRGAAVAMATSPLKGFGQKLLLLTIFNISLHFCYVYFLMQEP